MSTSLAQASSKSFDDSRHKTAPSLGAGQTLSSNSTNLSTLSPSPVQADTNVKPLYGPPVSRELYESRWNAKFEDLLYNYDFCLPSINPNADEIVQRAEYMFEKFSEWLPVLRYCLIEAKALGLLAERENQETSKKGFSVLDQVSILRFHVQGTAREWRGCMRGGMLGGKVEWVQLERELSGRMAGIIEDVDGLLGFGTGVRGDKGERAKTVEVKRQNSQEIIVRTPEETAWDVAAVERENLLSNISSSGVRSCLRLARVWERSRSLSCKCARADF